MMTKEELENGGQTMYLKILKWPDSQEVMDKDDWFSIQSGDSDRDIFGSSAYAKIIHIEKEFLKIQIKQKKGMINEIHDTHGNNK